MMDDISQRESVSSGGGRDRLEEIKERFGVDEKAQKYFQVAKGKFVSRQRIKDEWDPATKDTTNGAQGGPG